MSEVPGLRLPRGRLALWLSLGSLLAFLVLVIVTNRYKYLERHAGPLTEVVRIDRFTGATQVLRRDSFDAPDRWVAAETATPEPPRTPRRRVGTVPRGLKISGGVAGGDPGRFDPYWMIHDPTPKKLVLTVYNQTDWEIVTVRVRVDLPAEGATVSKVYTLTSDGCKGSYVDIVACSGIKPGTTETIETDLNEPVRGQVPWTFLSAQGFAPESERP